MNDFAGGEEVWRGSSGAWWFILHTCKVLGPGWATKSFLGESPLGKGGLVFLICGVSYS